jgi:NAD(P)H-flavin reductase
MPASCIKRQDTKETRSALLTGKGGKGMYRIVQKDMLTPNVISMRFQALNITCRIHLGQFVIIRADETGAYTYDD